MLIIVVRSKAYISLNSYFRQFSIDVHLADLMQPLTRASLHNEGVAVESGRSLA